MLCFFHLLNFRSHEMSQYLFVDLMPLQNIIAATIEYTSQRKAFGRPVLDNQVVHFRYSQKSKILHLYLYQHRHHKCNQTELRFLPPASVGRGKVLFSQVSACPHLGGGGLPIFQLIGGRRGLITYLPADWGVPTFHLMIEGGGTYLPAWRGGGVSTCLPRVYLPSCQWGGGYLPTYQGSTYLPANGVGGGGPYLTSNRGYPPIQSRYPQAMVGTHHPG